MVQDPILPARLTSPSGSCILHTPSGPRRLGGGALVVVYPGPAQGAHCGPQTRRARTPPPPHPARPPLCIQHPGFPTLARLPRPRLRSHFGLGSAPLPHPLPRSWPLEQLCPGPGPQPRRRAMPESGAPGPRPAAAPARVRPRAGPKPAPPAAAVSPYRPALGACTLPGTKAQESREGTRPKEGAGRAPAAAEALRAQERRAACPRAPGVRGAAPRNMTAPWAASPPLWGSLCAGKNEARRGERRKGARATSGRRAVFTNKGQAWPHRRATCSLHPRAGQARRAPLLVLERGGDLACAAACGAPVRGGDPRSQGSGYGRVEPRESEMKIGAWGRWPRGRADLIRR